MKEVICKKCQGHGEYLYKDEYESVEVKNQSCEPCLGLGYLVLRGDYERRTNQAGISDHFKRVMFSWAKT